MWGNKNNAMPPGTQHISIYFLNRITWLLERIPCFTRSGGRISSDRLWLGLYHMPYGVIGLRLYADKIHYCTGATSIDFSERALTPLISWEARNIATCQWWPALLCAYSMVYLASTQIWHYLLFHVLKWSLMHSEILNIHLTLMGPFGYIWVRGCFHLYN